MLAQAARGVAKALRARLRRRIAPGGKRRDGRGDGAIDVGGIGVRRHAERFAGRRILDIERAAGRRRVPRAAVVVLAVDRQLERGQMQLGCVHFEGGDEGALRNSADETARAYSGATCTSITHTAPAFTASIAKTSAFA